MRAVIEIEMDNAAFEDPSAELRHIFYDLCERLTLQTVYLGARAVHTIRDSNGNRVGQMRIEE